MARQEVFRGRYLSEGGIVGFSISSSEEAFCGGNEEDVVADRVALAEEVALEEGTEEGIDRVHSFVIWASSVGEHATQVSTPVRRGLRSLLLESEVTLIEGRGCQH